MADTTAKVVITAQDRTAAAIRSAENGMKGLQKQAAMVAGAMRGMLAGVGIGAGFAAMKSIADTADMLTKLSASTGVAATTLSELQYAAEKANIPFEAVATAIGKMNKTIGEAAAGSKSARAALDAFGVPLQNLLKMRPEERFSLLVTQMGRMKDESQMAAAGADVFGKGVADIIPLSKEGAGFIGKMATEARSLGLALTEAQIEDAGRIGDQIDELKREWMSFAADMTKYVLPVLKSIRFYVSGGAGFDAADELNNQILRLRDVRRTQVEVAARDPVLAQQMKAVMEKTARELADLEAKQQKLLGVGAAGATPARQNAGIAPPPAPGAAGLSEDAKKAADAEAKYWQNIRYEMNASERKFYEEMGNYAREYADDTIDQIERENEARRDARDNWQEWLKEQNGGVSQLAEFAAQAARNMQDAFAQFLFDPFKGGIKGMLKGFVDMIRQMIAQVAAAAILRQFFGWMSGLGGFWGSVGGSMLKGISGKAIGGPVMANQAYMVGERGPELFVPTSNGSITPNNRLGGGVTVAPVYNVDARGASADLVKSLPAILEANTRRAVELARATIYDDYSRGAFGRA